MQTTHYSPENFISIFLYLGNEKIDCNSFKKWKKKKLRRRGKEKIKTQQHVQNRK